MVEYDAMRMSPRLSSGQAAASHESRANRGTCHGLSAGLTCALILFVLAAVPVQTQAGQAAAPAQTSQPQNDPVAELILFWHGGGRSFTDPPKEEENE